ncbi:MAG: alpha/beta hydrolase [Microbacteriaceae bacterium]
MPPEPSDPPAPAVGGADAVALDAAIGDIDWRALPEGARRGAFAAPSGTLATLAIGEPTAPTVVLVPGITGSKEDFLLMLPLLAAAGLHALSFDMAGQYESAAAGPVSGRYTERLFVDDLLALLGSVRTPAHVLGYSFAGTVAQHALTLRPELFASLTLLGTPPVPGDALHAMAHFGPLSPLIPSRLGAAFMIAGVRANYTRVPPGRLRFVRERFALTRRSSVIDAVALMRRTPDLASAVRSSGRPVLVAVGEHDLWPAAAHRSFAERLGARLVSYPTGHSPCETTPHQLVRDMLALFPPG